MSIEVYNFTAPMMPMMSIWIAITVRIRPITLVIILINPFPSSAAIFFDERNSRYVRKAIIANNPITMTTLAMDLSAPTKFMAVAIVPGPASSGIPNGVTAKFERACFISSAFISF